MKTIKYIGASSGTITVRLVNMTEYEFEAEVPQELSIADADELLLTGVFEEVTE